MLVVAMVAKTRRAFFVQQNSTRRPPKPGAFRKALRIVADAEEVSQPDSGDPP